MIQRNTSEMLRALRANGFNADQAEQFLPEAESSLVFAMSNVLDSDDQDRALGEIDVEALAGNTGLDTSMVKKGLKTLLPLVMKKLRGESALQNNTDKPSLRSIPL